MLTVAEYAEREGISTQAAKRSEVEAMVEKLVKRM